MIERVHCIPVGDIKMHCAQLSCWCFPIERDHGVIVHNAKDCREAQERQDNANHGGWINIGEQV